MHSNLQTFWYLLFQNTGGDLSYNNWLWSFELCVKTVKTTTFSLFWREKELWTVKRKILSLSLLHLYKRQSFNRNHISLWNMLIQILITLWTFEINNVNFENDRQKMFCKRQVWEKKKEADAKENSSEIWKKMVMSGMKPAPDYDTLMTQENGGGHRRHSISCKVTTKGFSDLSTFIVQRKKSHNKPNIYN